MDSKTDYYLKDIESFQKAGFKLANKDKVVSNLYADFTFSPHAPDAVLVSQGDIAGTPLKHAIACLYKNSRESTFIYTALNENVEQSKLDALAHMGSLFYKVGNGTHVGAIPVMDMPSMPGTITNDKDQVVAILEKIEALKLPSVKMPMDLPSRTMLPFFSHENYAYIESSGKLVNEADQDEIVKCIAANLGDQSGVMDLSHEQELLLLQYTVGAKLDTQDEDNSLRMRNNRASPRATLSRP